MFAQGKVFPSSCSWSLTIYFLSHSNFSAIIYCRLCGSLDNSKGYFFIIVLNSCISKGEQIFVSGEHVDENAVLICIATSEKG